MTTDCTEDSSVVDWIIEYPESMAGFESLGIDCSCAGKSLAYACHQQGLDPSTVLAALQPVIERKGPSIGGADSEGLPCG
jgi:iron-sulfur cluster repair protein YtfE (RIC family)